MRPPCEVVELHLLLEARPGNCFVTFLTDFLTTTRRVILEISCVAMTTLWPNACIVRHFEFIKFVSCVSYNIRSKRDFIQQKAKLWDQKAMQKWITCIKMLFYAKRSRKSKEITSYTQTTVSILSRKVSCRVSFGTNFTLQELIFYSLYFLVYTLTGKPNSVHDSADGEEDGT